MYTYIVKRKLSFHVVLIFEKKTSNLNEYLMFNNYYNTNLNCLLWASETRFTLLIRFYNTNNY